MKKLVTISLMLAYLVSSTELKQLLKVPFLIEHFIEHKSEKNDLSLMAFFVLHYGSEHPKDADDSKKDMKLPFKSHEGCENNVLTILAPIFHLETNGTPCFYESTIVYLKEDQISSSSYLSAIWQPPKSC